MSNFIFSRSLQLTVPGLLTHADALFSSKFLEEMKLLFQICCPGISHLNFCTDISPLELIFPLLFPPEKLAKILVSDDVNKISLLTEKNSMSKPHYDFMQ